MQQNGNTAVSDGRTFGALLNVDWFQPYKHCPYSLGAMYLVIQNLPREERFKPENMIVVGIIPGPKEPKLHMNQFLKPLVDELMTLEKGISLKDSSFCGNNVYKLLLLCLSCDIPAARKCGGFKGHGAVKGCSRCLKDFTRSGFGSQPDYSGYDRENWVPRTNDCHRKFAENAKNAATATEKNKIETEYGVRYSELFRLPYFDAIRFTVIDPMHNLLLGTPKRQIKVWKELGVLDDTKFSAIQERMDNMKLPSDIGRIPRKISSGFCGFSADQWRVWTCIVSPYALKGVIDDQYYNSWMLFVKACSTLCARVVSKSQLKTADRELLGFCKSFERLYGKQFCTPNMHLHLHVKDCLLDHGPVYAFWLFACERMNGILGSYHINNTSIEVQIMRKFVIEKFLSEKSYPEAYSHYQEILINDCRGTVNELATSDFYNYSQRCVTTEPKLCNYARDSKQVVLSRISLFKICSSDIILLSEMFSCICSGDPRVLISARRCSRVNQLGDVFAVEGCRSERNSFIRAKWVAKEGIHGNTYVDPSANLRPGVITDIFLCDIMLEDEGKSNRVTHIIAKVKWFRRHQAERHYGFHSIIELWDTQFETESAASFIPMYRIVDKCVVVYDSVNLMYNGRVVKDKLNIVIPLKSKVVL